MRTPQNAFMERHLEHCRALAIPYEIWDKAKIKARLPVYDLRSYYPPRRMADDGFGEPVGGAVAGGVFFPTAGYVTDPQLATHNLQRAAEALGARFLFGRRVVEIHKRDGRIAGVRLDDGGEVRAPVVVNVAGPASAKVNAMAGALDDMTITTRALRQEVVHIPAPAGFNFEADGIVVSDSDIACYCRPEHGNNILIGSEDPQCDPKEWVDDEDDNRDFTDQWTVQGPIATPSACRRWASPRVCAVSSTSTTSPRTGSRSTTNRPSPASTWRSARAATSSRTQPSPAR